MAKEFCKNCDLYKTSCAGTEGQYKLNCIEGVGPKDAKIMIVAPAPGPDECKTQEPMTGEAGKLLIECLEEAGLKREDVFITNLVRCRTPRVKKSGGGMEDRDPLMREIKACFEYLEKEVAEVEPNVVILLGNIVSKAVIKKTGITQIHGHSYWHEDWGVTCVPLYHPSYLLHRKDDTKSKAEFVTDLKFAIEACKTKDFTEKPKIDTKYLVADTLPKVRGLVKRLKQVPEFVNDIETTGLNPDTSKMLCTAFSWKEGTGVTVPLRKWFSYFSPTVTGLGEPVYAELKKKGEVNKYIQLQDGEELPKKKTFTYELIGEMVYKLEPFWTPEEEKEIKSLLIPILENPEIKKIGHNIAFDVCYTNAAWGINIQGVKYDTMYGNYLPNPESGIGSSLENLAWVHTDMGGYDEGLKKERDTGFRDADINTVYLYASADCDCTYRVYQAQKKTIEPFLDIMQNILVPLSIAIREMEYNGVKVDMEHVGKMSKQYEKEIKKHETRLYSLPDVKEYIDKYEKSQSSDLSKKWKNSTYLQKRTDEEAYIEKNTKRFNFGSTVHLRALLFDHLGLPIENKTTTGLASTDEKTLESLRGKHEVLDSLLELRHLNKIYSTYLKPIPSLIDENERLHTSYRLDRTATGRLSSNKPNLQNIPKKKDGNDIRDYFTATGDNLLIESDLKQIEYRVLAHFVNDPLMIKDIENGLDIHRKIASEIYNIPEEQVTSEQRSKSKAVTFGVPYGRSSVSLAAEYGMAIDEAEEFRKALLQRYPKVELWINKMIEVARKKGYVKTYFGRIRYLPKINDNNDRVREAEERKVVSTAVQGTASDILSIYTININDRLKKTNSKTKLVLTVHDALFFDVPKDEAKSIIKMIKEEMERPLEGIRVPIETEIQIGTRWGSLVEYEEKGE